MMRRAGCCPMCSGSGASGEESTGGACWDCQGTGHPHLGPCGFWLWWKSRSAALLLIVFAWMVAGSVPVYLIDREWVVWIYFVGVPLAFAWLGLDAVYRHLEHKGTWNR